MVVTKQVIHLPDVAALPAYKERDHPQTSQRSTHLLFGFRRLWVAVWVLDQFVKAL